MSEAIQKIWSGLRKFITEPVQIYKVLADSNTIEKTSTLDLIGLTNNQYSRS